MPIWLITCACLPAQPATPTTPAHHHCTILVNGFGTNAAASALADIQQDHNLISTIIPACFLSITACRTYRVVKHTADI